MNCEDCTTLEQSVSMRGLALDMLRSRRPLTEQERHNAVKCCECASNKLALDATGKWEANNTERR